MPELLTAPLEASDSSAGPTPFGPIELIACDIDGTLLTDGKSLTARVTDAVKLAVGRGRLMVLASARPPRGVMQIYKHLGLRTVTINYNGALVYDPPTRNILLHRPISHVLARRIIEAGRRAEPTLVIHAERLNRCFTDRDDPAFQTETSKVFELDVVAPLDQWLDKPITKLMLLGPPAALERASAQISQELADELGAAGSAKPVRLVRTDPHLLQFQHPLTSKAMALAMVAQHYGVPQARVMAIGDALNDFGMVRWAGWGVAVGNARPVVKEVADAIVADNNRHGVAEALERFVLA